MMIPKRNISEPLVVTFSARMKQIIELNERDQALTLGMVSNLLVIDNDSFLQVRNHIHKR